MTALQEPLRQSRNIPTHNSYKTKQQRLNKNFLDKQIRANIAKSSIKNIIFPADEKTSASGKGTPRGPRSRTNLNASSLTTLSLTD